MQSPFDDEPLPIPPPKDHRSVFPSLPDPFTSSPTSTSKPLGTLVVVVLKARHLITASSSRWTKQSPYACLTLHTAPLPASPDAMSIMSSETGKLRRRKGSSASSRERRTSLGSIPPPERAATVDKLRMKMEKERAKTMSRTTLVATPEEDVLPPVEVDVEEEFDHKAALCTPVDPRGGQHPVWDAELRFPLTEAIVEGRRMVNIEIWAKVGLGRSDRPLGSARLDVERAIAGGKMDEWVPLSLNGSQRGEVFLNLTFFASPPSQIAPHPSPAPPPPPPAVPSAINSLLWRHGIPLRIPSFNLKFLVRKDVMPAWVRPKGVFAPQTWTSALGGVVAGFSSVFRWSWASRE